MHAEKVPGLKKVLNFKPKPPKLLVKMTSGVKTGRPDMSLDEACEIMSDWQVRRLPIVENEKLVGLVSLGDIALDCDFDVEIAQCLCDICEDRDPGSWDD